MPSLNKVMIIGNVTRDPELKYTPKGTAVTDLGIAINRNYTNTAGEKVEEVTYVDIELWGRLAEIAGEYAKKGKPVYIEGRLKIESWEDKETQKKRQRLKVIGEGLQLLGSNPGRTPQEPDEAPRKRDAAAPPQRPPVEPEDDDIPF